jgi:TP901 family phage tail tape measure protein
MGLGFVFTARDLASNTINNLERNFMSLDKRVGLGTERLQSSFQQLGTGLAVFSAGAVMVGGAFALANISGEFEQAIAAVGAVSGATTEELQQLRDAAIEAGVATQYSPTEATLGLRDLAQAGFNAQESIKLLIPVLDLAGGSLGELSPQQAAGLAAQAMKAFSLSADDASISVDRMLQAVNVFALNASELPLALGTASRGAQTLNQSLSETLISLGLVKNVIPSVERSSTAVAVAMERMVDPSVQQKLKGLGVEVTDSQHRFRAFLDIVGDLAPELNRMNDAERSSFLLKTFGTEALGGVNAILTQLNGGIRTTAGVTVKGADAIKYLRDQFENAGGTAAKFREQMLDTFEGQKKLLRGSLETLAIVAGEPFTQVLKPVVSGVVDMVNALLAVFRGLPAPVKRAFAMFTVAAGTVLSLVGVAITAKASMALLAIALKAAGITMGGFLATIAPAVLAVGLLAAAVAGFVLAYRSNLGGIADFANAVWQKVTLAYRGLAQLFQQGGFSDAVRDDLNRAENRGLKDFLINLYLWGNRLRVFFSGIAEGFSNGLVAARPAIDAFLGALRLLGIAMGFLSDRDDASVAGAKFDEFGATGVRVGNALVKVVEFLVQVMTAVVRVGEGIARSWHMVTASAGLVTNAFGQLGSQLSDSMTYLTGTSDAASENGSAWVSLGNVISVVIGVIVSTVGVLVAAVSAATALISAAIQTVISIFSGLADVVTAVVFIVGGIINGSWTDVWIGMKLVVFGVVDAIMGTLLELAGAIGGTIDAIAGLFGMDTKMQSGMRTFKDMLHEGMASSFGVEGLTFTPARSSPTRPAQPTDVPGALGSMPAVAAARAMSAQAPAATPAPAPPQAPVVVQLQVDGQTLATAVHRADQDSAGRAFSPVPSY